MTIRLIAIALAFASVMAATQTPHSTAQEAPAAQQAGVPLYFPWDGGDSWRYINGPHAGNAGVLAALDLQPPDAVGKPCGYVSDSWVAAAADGRVINLQNAVEIDHGNGFRTGYFHLGDKQVTGGYVRAGDRLGRPDCCPEGGEPFDCYSMTPHVHFYTVYEGAKQDIRGINIQGWILGSDDCFQKGAEKRCVGSSFSSTAPPPNDALPSARADVAIVIDGSDPSRQAARALAGALVNGDRAAVFGYGSGARQLLDFSPPGASLSSAIDDAIPGAGDPARGVLAGCSALSALSGAQARAVVAIGGGWHASEILADALACFAEGGPPLFVYDTAGALPEPVQAAFADARIQAFALAAVRDLPCEFQRLRSLISEDPPGGCASFVLRDDEVVAMPFEIAAGQTGATFSVRWTAPAEGSPFLDLRPVLLDPARERASPAGGSVSTIAGLNHKTFAVTAPAAGSWKLYVSGDGLPEEGVTIRLTSTSAAPPQQAEPAPQEPEPSPETTAEPPPNSETAQPSEESPTPAPKKTVIPKKGTPTPEPEPSPTPGDSQPPTPEPTPWPSALPTPPDPDPPPVPE